MRERGDETNGDSMVLGLIAHGTIGVSQNQQKNHPWREHCCKMDTKDTYWKIHRNLWIGNRDRIIEITIIKPLLITRLKYFKETDYGRRNSWENCKSK